MVSAGSDENRSGRHYGRDLVLWEGSWPQRSIGSRIVAQSILHVGGDDGFVALVADHRSMKIMPAFRMMQQQRQLPFRVPPVSPGQHGDERPIEIPAHVRQQIFVAFRRVLIETPVKHSLSHKARQPIGQDVGSNAKFRLDFVITAICKKSLANDHEAPFIADDLERA